MTILEYYKTQQNHLDWVENFQSTAKDKNGKLFSCLNVNFRSLASYFKQLNSFKSKDGLKREDWNSYQDNGQEKDKHRVVNLKNAGLIKYEDGRYFITHKGEEVLKINQDKVLTDREKWILLLMLIIDYCTDDRDLDLIKSVLELDKALKGQGLSTRDFLIALKKALTINEKNQLFQNDVFWIITFAKDRSFVKIYLNSTKEEKEELFNYVIKCSQNKKSNDLIAHKFVSGGAYSASTFNDDINIIFSILILLSLEDINWDNYINIICKCYYLCDEQKIKSFMKENKNIYDEVYENSFLLINKLLKKEEKIDEY